MLEGSILSAARCSEGIPPLHEAYENGIGDLKLGRRAVTTNSAAPASAALEDGTARRSRSKKTLKVALNSIPHTFCILRSTGLDAGRAGGKHVSLGVRFFKLKPTVSK